jgi:Domain of unknown function (DUF4386)
MLVRDDTSTDRLRSAAVTTGVLFIVATAASLAGSALSSSVLDRTDHLASLSGDANRVNAALLLQFIAAGASVGIALAMYPVLSAWGRGLSLGSVVFRTMEALLYIVAVVSVLSLLSVAQRFLGADAAHRASLQVVGDSLLDVRDQANLAAVMAFSVGALMYYYLLYRAQLVPRWLSSWGILAIISTLVACLLALFGRHPVTTYVLLVLPIAVQEIVLAVWLIAKGFRRPGDDTAPGGMNLSSSNTVAVSPPTAG